MPALDSSAVAALAERKVGWQDKAIPPAYWGKTVAEFLAAKPRLSALPTPLFTLSDPALAHNIATMAQWCADRGLELAPHGKSTMAPALWQRQLEAGAWGITVANSYQLTVARAFGVRRVMVANAVISPLAHRWIADQLAEDADFEVIVWADSVRTVELVDAARAAHVGPDARPLDVLVELGAHGGRTGARDRATARAIADAITASKTLRLAGVAGYEGSLSHGTDEASLEVIADYLRDLKTLHEELRNLYPADVTPIVTAGGSAYFDVVADVLAGLENAQVVLRSGAYVAHDDGFYRVISPLGGSPRTTGGRLIPAMHGWIRISSQPEPGLAIFDAGKRDLPFDEGMPEPQLLRPRTPGEPATRIEGLTIPSINDQHGFLRWDPAIPAPVVIGDELRLGLSHPCTAFDKWGLVPVIDDPEADDPVVVDLIRTFF